MVYDDGDDEYDEYDDDDDDDDDDVVVVVVVVVVVDDDNDGVEHVYWQPFFGEGTLRRNFRENIIGCKKIFDLTLLFPDIGAAVGALYSLTICNDGFP